MGVAAATLALAVAIDAGQSLNEAVQETFEKGRSHSPANTFDAEFGASLLDDSDIANQQAKISASVALASGTLPGLPQGFAELLMNDLRAALEPFQSESWAVDFLRYLSKKIYDAEVDAGASDEQAAQSMATALVAVSSGIYGLASRMVGSGSPALTELASDLETSRNHFPMPTMS
jgi:hypothetical protein